MAQWIRLVGLVMLVAGCAPTDQPVGGSAEPNAQFQNPPMNSLQPGNPPVPGCSQVISPYCHP